MIYVIDLFCGCGGFSAGAVQAGAKILLAADKWKDALDVHALNHPDAEHICTELGGDAEEFASSLEAFIQSNVPEGSHVHLHASPPCQHLSKANPRRDTGIGMSLVHWSIALAELLKAKGVIQTWSLEQVAATSMKELMPEHGGRVLKLDSYGVPQTRRRAILGNIDCGPISEYEEAPRTLQQLMDGLGIAAPEGFDCTTAGHGLKKRLPCGKESYSCRQFNQTCSTILSSHPSFYSTAQARSTAFPLVLAAEAQVFPRDYVFPARYGNKDLRLMIANAVSPKLSKMLIELAARTIV